MPNTMVASRRRIDQITADLYAGNTAPTVLMRERDTWASVCALVVATRDDHPETWEGIAVDAADLYKYADDMLTEYFKSGVHAVRSGVVEPWNLSMERAAFLAGVPAESRELHRPADVTDSIEAVDL